MIHPTAKMSEEANRKFHPRNTLLQLLALYTDPECYNAQCYIHTDVIQIKDTVSTH